LTATEDAIVREPTELFRMRIAFGQCDPNGHLNTAEYTALFDRATWLFFEDIGLRDGVGRDAAVGWADVRVVTEYKHEVRLGDEIRVLGGITKVGSTSVHLRHELLRTVDEAVCATYESVTVRFDLLKRLPMPVPDLIRSMAA
jgi:YbgC/YbaW family acyl-CoA thioester hydrolase